MNKIVMIKYLIFFLHAKLLPGEQLKTILELKNLFKKLSKKAF